MADRLRIGVVGCGVVARQVHLPLLLARPDIELVALADSDDHALAAAVRRCGSVRAYARLDDMLAAAGLDAVVVTLPTALHAAAACAVLEAGLHVFIEKPLAATLDEAVSVLEAWRRAGRIGVVGFNCRANALYVRMRELLRAGRAGAPVYLRTAFATSPRPLPEWKRHRGSGGGALLDLGTHHIDLIRYLTGREITGVRATIGSRVTEHDTALLELHLEDGIGVHAFCSLAAAEAEQVEVYGDAARLSVSRFTSLDVEVVDNPGAGGGALGRLLRRAAAVRHVGRALRARRAPLREPGYAILLERFVQAARTGALAADTPDIADGLACAAIIAAAEQSLVSGRLEKPAWPARSDEQSAAHRLSTSEA